MKITASSTDPKIIKKSARFIIIPPIYDGSGFLNLHVRRGIYAGKRISSDACYFSKEKSLRKWTIPMFFRKLFYINCYLLATALSRKKAAPAMPGSVISKGFKISSISSSVKIPCCKHNSRTDFPLAIASLAICAAVSYPI